MGLRLKFRPIWFLAGSLVLVGCAALAWFFLARRESVRSAAYHALAAVTAGDASTLMRYVGSDEQKLEGLNRDRLGLFLKTYYQPKLAGFTANGPPVETFFEQQGIVQLRQRMSHPDGRSFNLDIAALDSEEGPQVTALLSALFFNACSAEVPPNTAPPSGIGKFKFWVHELEQNRDQLRATGLPGIMLAKGAGMEPQFFTWDQLAQEFQNRIAKATRKPKTE